MRSKSDTTAPIWDYNGERQENGAALLQFHVNEEGVRVSAATAFLDPIADRKNLTVTLGAHVTKIVIDKGRATGVEYVKDGKTQTANAAKEVIVSAGALHSPQVLLLSGIGPAAELAKHGIDVVVDLPGVGQNLQDHVQLPVIYRAKVDPGMTTLLTGNVLFVNTREGADAAVPDLQLNFTPAIPAPLAPVLPDFGGPVSIFLPILVQPFSRGEVGLNSADPLAPPRINPNYLSQEADYKVFLKALEIDSSHCGHRRLF